MIVVDSSVWINAFRQQQGPEVERLSRALDESQVVLPDLVLMEVLQGCRSDKEFDTLVAAFSILPIIAVGGSSLCRKAASNYRLLRAKGVTVRSTIDTLIATRCILDDLPLLFSDRDFMPFVEYLGLRDAMAKDD